MIIDLNGFKLVNDTHGHAVGDELLVSIANALRRRLRTSDCIARIGGDEFAIILPDTAPGQAARVAEAVADEVSQTCVAVQGRDVSVGASIGVTSLDRHTASEGDALAAADRAMYDVKHTARPPDAPE